MRSIKNRAAAIAATLILALYPLATVFAAENVTMSIKDGEIESVEQKSTVESLRTKVI